MCLDPICRESCAGGDGQTGRRIGPGLERFPKSLAYGEMMWFSVFEVAKAHCLAPQKLSEFAKTHANKYAVELHAWGELVIDVLKMGVLLKDFQTNFPEYSNMPPDGEGDPDCDWHPLDFFIVDSTGNRVWSKDNPKWREEPPVVKRRLP